MDGSCATVAEVETGLFPLYNPNLAFHPRNFKAAEHNCLVSKKSRMGFAW